MEETSRHVMLVTGGTKNTGYATAQRFAREGYDVCITSRSGNRAQEAANRIMKESPGITAMGYELVPSDVDQIRHVFAQVKERFGRLDTFIANATATTGHNHNILSTKLEEYDFVMHSNARGYFFCTQEAARIMVEQGSGSIVLIGSVHARGAMPNYIVYAASKSAISSICRNAAYELGKFGVRVNCIIAGAIWNDRWEDVPEDVTAARRDNWPLGKESRPEDIANAVFFLASDQAATVTGSEFVVDSGVSVCLLKYDKAWDER